MNKTWKNVLHKQLSRSDKNICWISAWHHWPGNIQYLITDQYKPVSRRLITVIPSHACVVLSVCCAGAELLEIQRQVDRLSDPSSPECVGRLLQLHRRVLLLQFDTAVRHLIRSVSSTNTSCPATVQTSCSLWPYWSITFLYHPHWLSVKLFKGAPFSSCFFFSVCFMLVCPLSHFSWFIAFFMH